MTRTIEQALSDTALPLVCRVLMWHLRDHLDVEEFRPVKHEALAREARLKSVTVSASMARLVREGYLIEQRASRQLRAYRVPASRRPASSNTAPK